VADARPPDVQSCEARELDDRLLPDLRPRCARSTMPKRQLEFASAAAPWPGCDVRWPPMLAAKIDLLSRHADILSK
jgi:hypothetical protein